MPMLLRTITVSALATLVTAQALPRQPRNALDALPASTYAAARFGGLDACRAAAEALPMAPLVETFFGELPAELRAQLMEDGLGQAADELRRELQQVGLEPADLRCVLGQPVTVAVGRLSLQSMGPSLCLMIEGGQRREEINRTVAAVDRLLATLGVELEVTPAEVGGHELYCVQAADSWTLYVGWIHDRYVVSNSLGYVAEVARVGGGAQPGLAAATGVNALRHRLPAPPLMSVALNAATMMDAFAPHLPYEAADLSDALGLGRLDLLYGAVTAGERGGADLLHLGVGGSERGLAKALVAAPADLSFAELCSDNTLVFGAGSFDLPGVIDAFGRFVALLPDAAQREVRRELGAEFSRELRRMGTSPAEVDGTLRAFGDQVGFALSLEQGAKPELLVRLSVDDEAGIAALMQRVEAVTARAGGLEWRTRKAGEHAVRFCNLQIDGALQLSPCYVLNGDGLWVGSDALGLVRALRRAQKPGQSLAAADDIVEMARSADGASGVLHVRAFRGVELGWRTVETMLYPLLDARADEVGFDSQALPDQEQLAAALGTTTLVYRVDDRGLTVENDGSMALGALLAAIGAIGDEVLERASAEGR